MPSVRREIVLSLVVVCCLAAFAWLAMAIPFLLSMREQKQYIDTVFMPLAELRADFLHNGFGVFILDFGSHSRLSDDNVNRLLLLNELPQKYDLTVVIETASVTDASINTLAKLSSVDSLFVDKSGMTPEGVAELKSLLPAGTVSHCIWEKSGNGEAHADRQDRPDERKEILPD